VKAFQEELTHLINRHSIENIADMPDFILADMICRMIEAIGPKVKQTLDWHGCSSVCHRGPQVGECVPPVEMDVAKLESENVAGMTSILKTAMKVDAENPGNNPPITAKPDRMTYAELSEKYHELIMAVCQKFPNESRHQTALRYIRQAEAPATTAAREAVESEVKPKTMFEASIKEGEAHGKQKADALIRLLLRWFYCYHRAVDGHASDAGDKHIKPYFLSVYKATDELLGPMRDAGTLDDATCSEMGQVSVDDATRKESEKEATNGNGL